LRMFIDDPKGVNKDIKNDLPWKLFILNLGILIKNLKEYIN
jgi:hypothetical protein